ncbi:MAG: hypothetical protein MSG77_09340 [Prevotella sp.]|nr:hypothetical protein [Prevotella sp.]
MKKSLLVFGAVLLGVSANAQNFLTESLFSASKAQALSVQQTKNVEVKDFSAIRKAPKVNRAATQNSIAGIYILDGKGYQSNIHSTSADTLEMIQPTTLEGETYNFKMTFWAYKQPATAIGKYDEAAGTIVFPAQKVATNDKVGDVILSSIAVDENDKASILKGVSFKKDANGNFEIDGADAWCLYFIENEKAQLYNFGFEPKLYASNAVITGYRPTTDSDVEQRAYVTEDGKEVGVYNFYLNSYVYFSSKADKKTLSLPTGQVIFTVGAGTQQKYGIGPNIYLGAASINNDKLELDENAKEIPGTFEENSVAHFPGLMVIRTTVSTIDQQALIQYAAADTRITRTDKAYTVGITSIANDAAVKNDGKYYNLAGQEVTKDYKGVVIQNGKKFLNNK